MRKYIMELIVFICGASIMILELVASRVLAPYVGTSTFVWTSLIGIILGSLSLGYWLGGRLADNNPSYKTLSLVIFSSSLFIGVGTIIQGGLLELIQDRFRDIRIAAILSTVVLFAVPSILLGMVSPYAVKLKIGSIEKSGTTVGNLYAVSTIGSIIGTFVAGFLLIPFIGTMRIQLLLSVVLIITSIFAYAQGLIIKRLFALVMFLLMVLLFGMSQAISEKKGFVDVDTQYSRVWIFDRNDESGSRIRYMYINNEISSGMYMNKDDLVFEYTKYYNLARHFVPSIKSSLMIGGAGYSYPKNYLENFEGARMDVVEIDPKLTELARKYFNLEGDSRLNIFHEDGRTFLNTSDRRYDAILMDAFKSIYSLPYQLTTQEAVEKMYNMLTDNGVVVANVISAIEGEKGKFLRAEYATYKKVFPQVYVFPVRNPNNAYEVQNIIIAALKTGDNVSFESSDRELDSYLKHMWKKDITNDVPVLTDDYSPVESYIAEMLY